MDNVQAIYQARFEATGLEKRQRVWRTLCRSFFDDLVGANKDVLDMACGYGEFINNVRARKRYAIDMNTNSPKHLRTDVQFFLCPSTDMNGISDASVDVVFTSNFLEHLPNKAACDENVRRGDACIAARRPLHRPRAEHQIRLPRILGLL